MPRRKIEKDIDVGSSPFYMPFHYRSFSVSGLRFHLGCARGYNAMGLIGTEYNGVFMLCETHKQVVFDRHCAMPGCWYDDFGDYKQRAEKEIDRISSLPTREFKEFVKARPTLRYDPFK